MGERKAAVILQGAKFGIAVDEVACSMQIAKIDAIQVVAHRTERPAAVVAVAVM